MIGGFAVGVCGSSAGIWKVLLGAVLYMLLEGVLALLWVGLMDRSIVLESGSKYSD